MKTPATRLLDRLGTGGGCTTSAINGINMSKICVNICSKNAVHNNRQFGAVTYQLKVPHCGIVILPTRSTRLASGFARSAQTLHWLG